MITGIVVCFQCCIIQLNLIFLCIVIPTSYERLRPNLQTSEGFCGALFIAIQIKLCSLTQCNGLHNMIAGICFSLKHNSFKFTLLV